MRYAKLLIIVLGLIILTAACSDDPRPTATQNPEATKQVKATATLLATQTQAEATSTPALPTETMTSAASPTATQSPPSATPESVESPNNSAATPEALPESTEQAPASSEMPTPTQQDATPTPSPEPTGSTEIAQGENDSAGCTNLASYQGDITIPDGTVFEQEESFIKTWRVRNEGTCAWDESYSLVFDSGELMNSAPIKTLPIVPPEGYTEISVDLSAPAAGGTYRSFWMFEDPDGNRFGTGVPSTGPLWLEIKVVFVSPEEPSDAPGESASEPLSAGCAAAHDPAFEAEVLVLINQARAANALDPLTELAQLDAAALAHSQDMACNNFVSHVGSDGSNWSSRVAAQGHPNPGSAHENIYVGFPEFGGTPQGAFEWWMNSQVHRDNILSPNVNQIGLGYVYNPDSEYGGYATLVFALDG